MWRFLQGIPRAVRGQWRSAPQTVVREDENELYRGHIGLTQSPQNGRASAPVFTQTSKFGTASSTKQEHYEQNQSQKPTHPKEGEEAAHEERGARASSHEDPAGGHGPERDQWFHEWLESFRRDCHSAFAERHYSILEAVGWGSALLLGTQFAHYHGKKRRNEDARWCPLQNIYRYAFAMPTTARTALPHSQKKPYKSDSELEVQGDDSLVFLHDSILLDEGTGSSLDRLDQKQRADSADSAFAETDADWQKLTTTYHNVSRNARGYQLAQTGQYRRAVPLWKRASEGGYAKAHFNLGLCYELGKGVDKDLGVAVEYYRLAATDGHPKGLYNLGVMYLLGSGGLKKDPRHALDLLESAAMQGLQRAQTELGVLYTEEERVDMKKAASLFQMAALQEDPAGLYYLGICYENGWGVVHNECKAAEFYRKASDVRHAGAAYNLAFFFENGLGGLPEDSNAAAELYKTSAQLGNREAEKEFARLSPGGDCTSGDPQWQLNIEQGESTLSGDPQPQGLSGSASTPAFSDYICKHLLDFGFGDTDVTESMFGAKSKPTSRTDSTVPRGKLRQPSIVLTKTDSSQAEVKFYIGEEEDEDGMKDANGGKAVFADTESGSFGNGWLLGGSFVDSGYSSSSLNGGSRSCSLNELSQMRNAHDQPLVSCT